MYNSISFIAEQFQQFADINPVTAFEDQGCIIFNAVPVFYERLEDCFVLDVEGIRVEVPRI